MITIPAERLPPAPLDSAAERPAHRIEPRARGHGGFDVDQTGTDDLGVDPSDRARL